MNKELHIKRYTQEAKGDWNLLVKNSKNGTFLFDRDYMDYHNDRFQDHSVLIYQNEKLIALFPANVNENQIQSHGGLSYGGLVYTTKLRVKDIIRIFDVVLSYYKEQGIQLMYYKAIPSIYHKYPASEDLYALFAKNAELYRRDISSTIEIQNKLKLSKGRKWLLARAKKENIEVSESMEFEQFFDEYNIHLNEKYGLHAVHTAEEIKLLQSRFPNNIKLFIASKDNQFLGGAILYITHQVVHTQYIHFTFEGKEMGAFDLLMNYLLEVFKDKRYFDFGISTEKQGRFLNEGLISFKESFGARATVCDFYKLHL